MKKVVSILLIISSLFTLSSSVVSCAASEVPEISKVESSSDTKSVSEKDITKEDQGKRDEKIKKFLAEKRKYFPENKLMDIKSLLHTLKDDELEIVLNVNFKKPGYITLAAALGGFVGLDSFMLGNKNAGIFKMMLTSSHISTALLTLCGLKYLNSVKLSDIGKVCLGSVIISLSLYDILKPILNWSFYISTASARAKIYNYQLLLNTIGKK